VIVDERIDFATALARVAGIEEQPADFRERHIERAAMADEAQGVQVHLRIAAISRRFTLGRVEQAFSLVVANGLDVASGLGRYLSDSH
jgi:hypothetical protein